MRFATIVRRSLTAGFAAVVLTVPALADPALWHLSDEDSDIYLFGTIHIMPPDLEWRNSELDAAFAAADTVYFETDTGAEAQAAMQPLVMQLGINPEGQPLSGMLDAETSSLLERVAPLAGFQAAQLEPFQPWLAALTISVTYMTAKGHDPESGVERILTADAIAAGKTLGFFETPEQQLRFFADMPEALQVEFLNLSLAEIDSGEFDTVLQDLDDSWVNGDLTALDMMINQDMATQQPEVYQRLILDRNASWVPQIETILAGEGTVFIAVGAGHLVGENGVVEQLRARGYELVGP